MHGTHAKTTPPAPERLRLAGGSDLAPARCPGATVCAVALLAACVSPFAVGQTLNLPAGAAASPALNLPAGTQPASTDQLILQAHGAIETGDFNAAREAAEALRAVSADERTTGRLLAQIERAETDAEQAARGAAEVQGATQLGDADAHREATIRHTLRVGRRALRRDEYNEAMRAAETVLAIDPGNETARRLLTDASAERDARALAQRQAAQTAADEPDDSRVQELLGQAESLMEGGQYDQAITTAEQVYQIDVDNTQAQRLIAQAREEAEEASERIAGERSEQIEDLLRDARRALRRGRNESAIESAQQALAMGPGNEGATEVLGEAQAAIAAQAEREANELAQQAAEEEARAQAQRAEEIHDLLRDAGRSLRRGRFEQAAEGAQQVLAMDEGNEQATALLAEAQAGIAAEAESQSAEAAQEVAEQEARRQADLAGQVEDLLHDADRSLRRERFEAAIEQAQQVLALDADNAQASEILAQAQAGVAAEAERASAANAAEENEQRAGALYDRARAEQSAGDLEAALATSREASGLDPDNRRIQRLTRRLEGEVAEAAERAQAALAATEAQRVDSVDDALRRGQQALERGRVDEALAHFRAALEADPANEAAQAGLAAAEQAQAEAEAASAVANRAETLVAEGQAALDAGNLEMAAERFEEAMALAPDLRGARRGLAAVEEAQSSREAQAESDAQEAAQRMMSEQRAQSERLVVEGRRLEESGDLEAARARMAEALAAWSENLAARRGLERVERRIEHARGQEEQRVLAESHALIDGLLQEGNQAYAEGDVLAAVDRWRRVLEIDANNDRALVNLQNTEEEFQGALTRQQTDERRLEREQEMGERLGTPITIQTPTEGTPLQVFLNNISVFTDLDFVIADGLDVTVTASFVEQPLRQVLESVITANGLRWRVEDTVITIQSNLQTRFVQLSPDNTASLRVLEDSGALRRLLYPPDGVPSVADMDYHLDDITGTFVVTGSGLQLERIDNLMANLDDVSAFEEVTRIFRVREQEGERIKQLVEAVLETEAGIQERAFERRIILQGENLIVRATEGQVRRVEQLLQEFGEDGLTDRGLEVATFSLIPRRVLQRDEDVARALADSIRETVEVLLYSQIGTDAARREGRRLWYDEFTLQLTITDTPDNIDRVTRYISSIDVLEPRRTTRVRYLEHQQASSLASKIGDFLDIEVRGAGESSGDTAGGDVVVRTLRADDEFTFRDLRITLITVEENDINNDRDEDVTLIIDTLTSSEERTIEELRSEIVDDYRIRVVDADSGGINNPNSGRAELEITFLGAGGGVGGGGGGGGTNFQRAPQTGQTTR